MDSISEIKANYNDSSIETITDFIDKYSSDERAGVIKLVTKANRDKEKLDNEYKRIKIMQAFDASYTSLALIAGVDEVGRGPFAGPVVCGAAIMPKDCDILYINDSKKVKKEKREELAELIKEQAISYNFGLLDNTVIDEIGIGNAVKQAMVMAIKGLSVKPEHVLVDAVKGLDFGVPYSSMIKGDAQSYNIASASIIAKVYRDKIMEDYAKKYPQYGFDKHSGYGTKEHIEAIKEYGPCPIHRMSFIKNYV
ncbi:MAG: ribonuclease HII [Lachnospiraceae bacterium]|nr:ribonuclease HII [Lachnospiraceae bacterium]